jgi:hypothetical protein
MDRKSNSSAKRDPAIPHSVHRRRHLALRSDDCKLRVADPLGCAALSKATRWPLPTLWLRPSRHAGTMPGMWNHSRRQADHFKHSALILIAD